MSISFCASIASVVPGVLPFNVVPTILQEIGGIKAQEIIVIDDRAKNIDEYFAKLNLPLAGYGKTFVEVADKYDLDYRLLPAIAMRESTGGKHACWNDDDNVFGWHSCKTTFNSQEAAIDKVGAHLAGEIKSTKGYYGNKTVWKKLRTYNSVIAPYPDQVIAIMNKIEKGPVEESEIKIAKSESKEIAIR